MSPRCCSASTHACTAASSDDATVPCGDGWFDEEIRLGARLGRYELRTVVGSGGMGIVFEAHDPELDRPVAVKVLRGTLDDDGAARLRDEGRAIARLTDPNVIRIYDLGVSYGHAFVVLEFVAGGTLATWLRRAPRAVPEVVATFIRAGRGLAAAHDAGLVHRDFKPSNVLVGDDGRVLVTDFGMAYPAAAGSTPAPRASRSAAATVDSSPALSPSVTRTAELLGTPAYMAPEQYLSASIDTRADQFSFCVALWRALYGRPPCAVGTPDAPAASARPATVPPFIRAALERGLAREPTARYDSMRDLLAALEWAPRRARAWSAAAPPRRARPSRAPTAESRRRDRTATPRSTPWPAFRT